MPLRRSTAFLVFAAIFAVVPLLAQLPPAAPAPSAPTAPKPAADPLAGWDAFVNKALADWRVPGVAMAVVKDDKVLLSKGYGFRDLEKKLPVTDRTLFAIGSTTKAFTTFVMGTLADEGKLDWKAPVTRYIPDFRLKDPVATERMTAIDLVTHRSGLPRHDLLWYNATLSRQEMVERLRWLEPSKDFRTDFQYNNAMFLTAGYVVERITGTTWEEAVRTRVFKPLGMTEANFSVLDSQKAPDFALPYEERDGKLLRMEFRNITNAGPAGSINASARDLVPWLRVHLAGGKLGEKAVASPTTIADLHMPRMETGAKQTEPEIVPGGYALGWGTEIYQGHQRVYHGGAIDGFSALVLLIPGQKIGVAILVNADGSSLPGLLARHLTDRLLALPPKNWSAERLAQRDAMRAAEKEAETKKATFRKSGTSPAHPLDEYVGDYEDPGYGVLSIARTGNALTMTYNGITTPLEHWHYETWNGLKIEGEKADHSFEDFRIQFRTDFDGEVSGVAAPMEPAVHEIVFVRKPDVRLSDPAFLARLAGTYALGPQKAVFTMQGRSLALEIDGRRQPVLLPYTNNRFRLEGARGITLKFDVPPEGLASKVLFVQPNGVFEAKRAE